MRKLIITALTPKGKMVLKEQGEMNKKQSLANKIMGVEERIISENPLIIEVTAKHIPLVVFTQLKNALSIKFIELGAAYEDFKIEEELNVR